MERFYQAMEECLNDMIEVSQANKFNPLKDMAAIPLNTKSPEFNAWKVERPKILNPKRAPGLIYFSRYIETCGTGIKTFAGAPVAIYTERFTTCHVHCPTVVATL